MVSRSYGVEIECIMPNFNEESIYFNRKFLNKGWEYDWDGSLNYGGIEFKSPILSKASGFKEIKRMTDWLARRNARIDKSCGLHVHHNAHDLTKSDILRIVKSWEANQKQINKLLAPSRARNNWCLPWTKMEIRELEIEFEDDLEDYYDRERYKAINIESLHTHGTIEIRQHEGTIDFEEIRSWIIFGQSFIENVAKKRKKMLNDVTEIPVLLNRIRVPERSKEFYAKKMKMASRV